MKLKLHIERFMNELEEAKKKLQNKQIWNVLQPKA